MDNAHGAPPELTVLYVEDNASNLRLVERVLSLKRPQIALLSAMAGESGLEAARERAPDAILLDLDLPDISGEEVLRRLQDDARTREIPVAVVSAEAMPGHDDRLLAAGARAYLTKPLDLEAFLAVVDEFESVPASGTRR